MILYLPMLKINLFNIKLLIKYLFYKKIMTLIIIKRKINNYKERKIYLLVIIKRKKNIHLHGFTSLNNS